jgi:hypothetical protein
VAIHGFDAAVPANDDLGDQKEKVGEHLDLTPDTDTVMVEVRECRGGLATCNPMVWWRSERGTSVSALHRRQLRFN